MGSIKRSITLVVMVCFMISIILPVYANNVDDVRRELNDVSRQIQQQQSQLNDTRKQERSLLGQVQTIEQNIVRTQNEIASIENRIKFLKENIAKTEQEIEILEEELVEQTEFLNQRLVFIYERGDISYLEVLLSASDIKDFLTRYDMLNKIIEQDMELIEIIDRKQKDLNTRKSNLEVQSNELIRIQETQKQRKEDLASQAEEKKTVLGQVRQEKSQYEKALAELEAASRQLEQMIRSMQGNTGATGTGIMTWPAPGYTHITSPYGMRFHPILQTRRMHTGVDVGAPMNANLVAADDGVVIFAGWQSAYGQTTIIDHGNGISTLYAHQERILVTKGSTVTKGQIIGKVGSTGWSTGPHLHFEVRKNGTHVNPRQYI